MTDGIYYYHAILNLIIIYYLYVLPTKMQWIENITSLKNIFFKIKNGFNSDVKYLCTLKEEIDKKHVLESWNEENKC